MCPILMQIGPLSAWGAAVIALVTAGVSAGVEVVEQRRTGSGRPGRVAVMALLGAAVGVALAWGINRWGPVQVRSWGTMFMVAFVSAMVWVLWDAREDEAITTETMIDLTLVILIGSVIGARGLSVILEWDSHAGDPASLWRVWEGGLSFHGGLIGGTVAGCLYMWRAGLSIPHTVDRLAPAIALGYAITRIGCFLNGCCWGSPSDLPWAVIFPPQASGAPAGVPIHPTQLYHSGASLVIFGLLLLVRRRLARPGHLFVFYLAAYSVARFIIEHFRRGASAEVFGPLAPLTVAQTASVAIFIVAAGWLIIRDLRARGNSTADADVTEGRQS